MRISLSGSIRVDSGRLAALAGSLTFKRIRQPFGNFRERIANFFLRGLERLNFLF